MSSPETTLRYETRDPTAFLAWAARATRGQFSVYHTGNLAAARLADPKVEELASLALLLHEMRWINAIQARKHIADDIDYIAVRTGTGRLPMQLARGLITATDYRILSGLTEQTAALSIARAIRGMLPIGARATDDAAKGIIARFAHEGWIEKRTEHDAHGWQVSPAGRMMLR